MPTLTIIEDLNKVEDIRFGYSSCPVGLSMNSFPFKGGKETFGHRVIVTISRTTHAARDALIPKKFLEIVADILTATITMMNEARCWGSSA
jgi:hypothetical protein